MITITSETNIKCSSQHSDYCLVHKGSKVIAIGQPGSVTYAPAAWTMILGTQSELVEYIEVNQISITAAQQKQLGVGNG